MQIRFWLTTLLVFALQAKVPAQQHGKILCKASHSPVAYAHVIPDQQASRGTTSNEDGYFVMERPTDIKRLDVSHIAYQTLEIGRNELHTQGDTLIIYLHPNAIQLSEILVKPRDFTTLATHILRSFLASFKHDYAFAKAQMVNTAQYHDQYISFQESVGYLYFTPRRKSQEMIFLPLNTRSSEVVYLPDMENNAFIYLEKQNSFKPLKNQLDLFQSIGPLNTRQWRDYHFHYSTQNTDEQTMVFTFSSKANKPFHCAGSIQVDFQHNIIRWIKVDTLYSKDELNLIQRNRQPSYSGQLEIHFQHKNNRIHYHRVISTLQWHSHFQGLSHTLDLVFHNFPKHEQQALYHNPGQGYASSFMVYEGALVRIYYDPEFWARFKDAHQLSPKLIADLSTITKLEQQFQNHHLKYSPELDTKRLAYFTQAYQSGEMAHRMQTQQGVVKNHDFLTQSRLVDSYIYPVILGLNQRKEMAWWE